MLSLGKNLTDVESEKTIFDALQAYSTSPSAYKAYCSQLGSYDEVDKVISIIKGMERGFVVALGREILTKGYELREGDTSEGDVTIRPVGRPGIHYTAIVAIYPIGTEDEHFLESLRAK